MLVLPVVLVAGCWLLDCVAVEWLLCEVLATAHRPPSVFEGLLVCGLEHIHAHCDDMIVGGLVAAALLSPPGGGPVPPGQAAAAAAGPAAARGCGCKGPCLL